MMPGTTPLKVITRNSPLALAQVAELFALFPHLRHEVLAVASYGDRHKEMSLLDGVEGDFFTRELDRALLAGEADVAVHSAKDLPYPLPAGLRLLCLTEATDKSDALVSRGSLSLAQLPAGSRVGTSSAMRKAELERLRPDVEVVGIRGTIQERLAQVDDGHVDALIVASCALIRLGLTGRIAERLPFKTHPLQGNLAVVGRTDAPDCFAEYDIRRHFGRVTLVGAGPSDPELLTLAGDKALREADIIFHDALVDQRFIQRYAAKKVNVGKRAADPLSHAQNDINEQMYEAALAGMRVVRLKGGDPMVFAHGREEIDFLQSRFVEVDVIPGVTAGVAMAALTKIPLTHRGLASSVAFVSGHNSRLATPQTDTLVYYMGASCAGRIAAALIEAGRSANTPALLGIGLSTPQQRTIFTTLDELSRSLISSPMPVLIVVGQVVALQARATLGQVLYTGTLAPERAGVGERVVHTPLIELTRRGMDDARVRRVMEGLVGFDYILFTSRHGVSAFTSLLDELGSRPPKGCVIASVGPVTTAELARHGLRADMESPTQSAEGLLDLLRHRAVAGKRILLPRSNKGVPSLPEGLKALGAEVTDLPLYDNRTSRTAVRVDLAAFHKIVFSSPSGVEAFVQIYGALPQSTLLVAKGQTTLKRMRAQINITLLNGKHETIQTTEVDTGGARPQCGRATD